MSGFFRALPVVLEAEGGLSDDPDDRGGLTNHGVTQETYDRWRKLAGEPLRSVEKIDPEEIQAVYHQLYWIPGKCDALPWPASLLHFDACVNHGVGAAAALLQRAVGVEDDGVIGPVTLGAVAAHTDLVDAMLWERLAYYSKIAAKPRQSKFLRGWLNRVLKLRRAA